MITQTKLFTRSVTHADLPKLANLIHFEGYVHRHLDYRPPLDWIGRSPFCVLERYGEVVATLACPPDPPNVAWLRLFAVSNHISVEKAWEALWSYAYTQLANQENPVWVAAIPMHLWFARLLEKSNFEESQSIVLLRWEGSTLPQKFENPFVNIRPMNFDDLETVVEIDHAAFIPVWQNSLTYLEYSFKQAIVASVAEVGGKVVGYQISTATPLGGHLARLAVRPSIQGNGVGYCLLYDLLSQLILHGNRIVTVNTQKDNQASLNLYKKAGFQVTGEEYPFYQLHI
jgi:ribosomal protein S18 acetylase RimI-like enzyme